MPAERAIDEAAALDLDHLARQTLGDGALQREVLGLFVRELETAAAALADGDADTRRALAHRLKGAARGVGAGAVAAAAAALEAAPGEAELAVELTRRMAAAAGFIAERGLCGAGASRPG